MGLTQQQVADAIGVPYQRVNELVNGKRGVTTSTALKLARAFNISPDFWLNLQLRCDLYKTLQKEGDEINKVKSLVKG